MGLQDCSLARIAMDAKFEVTMRKCNGMGALRRAATTSRAAAMANNNVEQGRMPGVTSHVLDEAISISKEKDEGDEEDVPLCNIVVHGEPDMTSQLEVASVPLTEIPVAEVATTTTQPSLQKSMAAADEWSESSDSDNESSPSTPR